MSKAITIGGASTPPSATSPHSRQRRSTRNPVSTFPGEGQFGLQKLSAPLEEPLTIHFRDSSYVCADYFSDFLALGERARASGAWSRRCPLDHSQYAEFGRSCKSGRPGGVCLPPAPYHARAFRQLAGATPNIRGEAACRPVPPPGVPKSKAARICGIRSWAWYLRL